MQTSCESPYDFLKELEAELNNKLYSFTNSVPFITLAKEALDHHLDMVTVIRTATVQWLEFLDCPSRDEVADIAKKIIKIEERLDLLDEGLYLTLIDIKHYQNQIVACRDEIVHLNRLIKGGKVEMAEKKETNIKKEESPKTTKRRRNSVENPTVENEFNKMDELESLESEVQEPILKEETKIEDGEESTETKDNQEQFSTLDILWNHAFRELDQWAKHADFRDDVFLKEAMYFAESIKRNQENIKAVREQFSREFANWERTAREEILMSTTALQHIFPKRSYEEINQQIDQIQSRTTAILRTPLQMAVSNQLMEQYFQMIEQYIALRKNGRKQYIKTLKQAASLIYESQKGFVNLFTGQLKTLIFPLNKYMEKAEELTKS